jgi:enoyl-CoA hydratase/carnithine racemase
MNIAYKTIRLDREGAVAKLTINRPQRLNAMNKEALEEIQAALEEVETDDRVRALVVAGEGAHFSSGFDL